MTVMFVVLLLISVVLFISGWLLAKKKYPQTFLTFFLLTVGIVLWVLLTSLGFGAQSLANFIEVFGVVVVAVAAAYLKFFVFDHWFSNKHLGFVVALVIVVVVTIAFRLFMPSLPE